MKKIGMGKKGRNELIEEQVKLPKAFNSLQL